MLFAAGLAVRQQFLPNVIQHGDQYQSRVDAALRRRRRPPAVRTGQRDAGLSPSHDHHFIGPAANYPAAGRPQEVHRQPRQPHRPSGRQGRHSGVRLGTRRLAPRPDDGARRHIRLRAFSSNSCAGRWRNGTDPSPWPLTPLTACACVSRSRQNLTRTTLQTALREQDWYLRYLLQPHDDHSLLLPTLTTHLERAVVGFQPGRISAHLPGPGRLRVPARLPQPEPTQARPARGSTLNRLTGSSPSRPPRYSSPASA